KLDMVSQQKENSPKSSTRIGEYHENAKIIAIIYSEHLVQFVNERRSKQLKNDSECTGFDFQKKQMSHENQQNMACQAKREQIKGTPWRPVYFFVPPMPDMLLSEIVGLVRLVWPERFEDGSIG
ncbi:hypothetical protein STEG23_018021, partial [Scotinomys teguina]